MKQSMPLQNYFDSLNVEKDKKCFVVRSSAICEDSENYSMAGVFSSFINLNTFSQLIEAIKKCYASLFSNKALSMITRYKIPLKDLKMGIIVQEFINGKSIRSRFFCRLQLKWTQKLLLSILLIV